MDTRDGIINNLLLLLVIIRHDCLERDLAQVDYGTVCRPLDGGVISDISVVCDLSVEMEGDGSFRDVCRDLIEEVARPFVLQASLVEVVDARIGDDLIAGKLCYSLCVREFECGDAEVSFAAETGGRRLGSLDECECAWMGAEEGFDGSGVGSVGR